MDGMSFRKLEVQSESGPLQQGPKEFVQPGSYRINGVFRRAQRYFLPFFFFFTT
jgi:hypothetical protein